IYSKHSVTTTNNSPVRQLTVTPTRAPQIATSESHEGGGGSGVGSFPLDARVDLTQPQCSPTSHSSLESPTASTAPTSPKGTSCQTHPGGVEPSLRPCSPLW